MMIRAVRTLQEIMPTSGTVLRQRPPGMEGKETGLLSQYRDKPTGWMTGIQFSARTMMEFFLTTTSRPALRPTETPI